MLLTIPRDSSIVSDDDVVVYTAVGVYYDLEEEDSEHTQEKKRDTQRAGHS